MLTIPYTTVYCPPMTYGLIISQRREKVKRKLVIQTQNGLLQAVFKTASVS